MRIEKLKAEQRAELEEAMYSQSAVPLKSTLVASLTATPSVSQLLCAFKDQTEDYMTSGSATWRSGPSTRVYPSSST